jgi:hypothetical protein
LHKICVEDKYAWAVRKLVNHKTCNVNVKNGSYYTPLHQAARLSSENLKILLTCDDVMMGAKECYVPSWKRIITECNGVVNDVSRMLLLACNGIDECELNELK